MTRNAGLLVAAAVCSARGGLAPGARRLPGPPRREGARAGEAQAATGGGHEGRPALQPQVQDGSFPMSGSWRTDIMDGVQSDTELEGQATDRPTITVTEQAARRVLAVAAREGRTPALLRVRVTAGG